MRTALKWMGFPNQSKTEPTRHRRISEELPEETGSERLLVVGYVKTYVGEGSESVLLTDWTSLHIDVLAKDRGLKRLAYSLYEI